MIRIFNIKTKREILIDNSLENVFFMPVDWDFDNPHIKLILENVDLLFHTSKCEDCKSLLDSFGSITKDWHIDFLGKVKRLNLENIGNEYLQNQIIRKVSSIFNGTELKLNIDTDTIEILSQRLKIQEELENYEECVLLKSKIELLKEVENIEF